MHLVSRHHDSWDGHLWEHQRAGAIPRGNDLGIVEPGVVAVERQSVLLEALFVDGATLFAEPPRIASSVIRKNRKTHGGHPANPPLSWSVLRQCQAIHAHLEARRWGTPVRDHHLGTTCHPAP
jgi:hypothetical protein